MIQTLPIEKKFLGFARSMAKRQKEAKPHDIVMMELAINAACNLKCSHCSAADTGYEVSALKLDVLDRIFEEARRADILTVIMVGGEPSLHPQLPDIIRSIASHGLMPSLITNGWKATPELLRTWVEAGLGTLCFSLHGATAETHESMVRVQGAYQRLRRAIDAAVELGIRTAVSVTPTHYLVQSGEFAEMLRFIREKGLEINYNYPAVVGRNKDGISTLLTHDELEWLRESSEGIPQWSDFWIMGHKKCIAAKHGIYVTVDGEVCPCAFMHFSFGNILKEGLAPILERMRTNSFFAKNHKVCLVGEDPVFARDFIQPIYESGSDGKPVPIESHPTFAGAERNKAFHAIFQPLRAANPLFASGLDEMVDWLEHNEASYELRREEISKVLSGLVSRTGRNADHLAKAYRRVFMEYLRCQKSFHATGVYPGASKSDEEIRSLVYEHPDYMTDYMLALLFSYVLWPSKYRMTWAFEADFSLRLGQEARILDIGTGHGYFLGKALHGNSRTGLGIDLSLHSLDLAKHTLDIMSISEERVRLQHRRIEDFEEGTTFDGIIFSEVVEHLRDPDAILGRLPRLLAPGGKIFFVTAINTAVPDHVQHYRSQADIRPLLERHGFEITQERVHPEFQQRDLTDPVIIAQERVSCAYSAVLSLRSETGGASGEDTQDHVPLQSDRGSR